MKKLGVVAVTALMAGCTVSGPDPVLTLGIPNPASVYCIERGGTLDIHERPEGNISMCVLPDGTKVDEWEFYRRNHPNN